MLCTKLIQSFGEEDQRSVSIKDKYFYDHHPFIAWQNFKTYKKSSTFKIAKMKFYKVYLFKLWTKLEFFSLNKKSRFTVEDYFSVFEKESPVG